MQTLNFHFVPLSWSRKCLFIDVSSMTSWTSWRMT